MFDFWESHTSFEQFCDSHQAELDRFDRLVELEGVVDRKEFLGMFYMDTPEDEDGQDLVPS